VKLACELPDRVGRSLSTWTCAELARTLKDNGVVDDISPQSVQRILSSYKLKPWRVHYWLTPKVPRDAAFRARVEAICDLYTRPLDEDECVLCVDEKTSIQPRPRAAPTRPARLNLQPVRVEHEYARRGALNLLAAFDTRTGKVMGICRPRKRQVEFIELLELLDRSIPASKTRIHIVCDNVRTHHGKLVRAWLAAHPRFLMHFPPVHCSWMNQIEQWFGILQRKRLKLSNFVSLDDLGHKILAFIDEWNDVAAPFEWTAKSFQKVLAKVDAAIRRAA
jgi:transposase